MVATSAIAHPRAVRLMPKELAVPHLVFSKVVYRALDRFDGLKASGLLHEGHCELRFAAAVAKFGHRVEQRRGCGFLDRSTRGSCVSGSCPIENKWRTRVNTHFPN